MKFKLFDNSKKTGGHKFQFNPLRCSYSPGYTSNCAINAFRCIDIISDESYGKLSDYTKEHNGISLCDIVKILQQTYTRSKFRIRKMVFDDESKIKLIPDFLIKYCELINLQDNECIMLSIMNDDIPNHIVLLANYGSEIYIIDKQIQSKTCRESLILPQDYFEDYIVDKIPNLTLFFLEDVNDKFFTNIKINKNFYTLIPSKYFDHCTPDDVAVSLYVNKPGNKTPPYTYPDEDQDIDQDEDIGKKRKRPKSSLGGKPTKKRKPTKKTTKKRK